VTNVLDPLESRLPMPSAPKPPPVDLRHGGLSDGVFPMPEDIGRIAAHPLFRQLARERRILGGVLAITMATVYFGYILTIAFRPDLLGIPVHESSVVTWGFVVGAALLSFGFVLTAIYVFVANTRLDTLTRHLLEDLR
jgi:uncharacterized membrane protein (DUF485 family)